MDRFFKGNSRKSAFYAETSVPSHDSLADMMSSEPWVVSEPNAVPKNGTEQLESEDCLNCGKLSCERGS